MPVVLSITGLFKTIFIIIGVFVLLRFLGQLMQAKRNLEEQNRFKAEQLRIQKEKAFVEKNLGKISISKEKTGNTEDVDFEEI